MREVKTVNLVLDIYGNYLGMEEGCIILRDRHMKERKGIHCLRYVSVCLRFFRKS